MSNSKPALAGHQDPFGGSSPLSSPPGSPPSGSHLTPSHASKPFDASSPLSSIDENRVPSPEPSSEEAAPAADTDQSMGAEKIKTFLILVKPTVEIWHDEPLTPVASTFEESQKGPSHPSTPMKATSSAQHPFSSPLTDLDSDASDDEPSDTLPTAAGGGASTSDQVPNAEMDLDKPVTPPRAMNTKQSILKGSQSSSTPMKANTVMTDMTSDDKNKEHRTAVGNEVGTIYVLKKKDALCLYNSIASREAVLDYLEKEKDLYDWKGKVFPDLAKLSDESKGEEQLYDTFMKVATTIMTSRLALPCPAGVSRKIVKTFQTLLVHDDGKSQTKPDISIQATGPSFEKPDVGDIGYSDLAAVVDGKLDSKFKLKDDVEQGAVYCRQIAIQQPNRNWSRAMFFSHRRFRMIHYDRSGVYATPIIDFHGEEGRVAFVRCILGLTSPDEAVLGLDTSVQWVIDNNTGKKISGTIRVLEDAVELPTAGGEDENSDGGDEQSRNSEHDQQAEPKSKTFKTYDLKMGSRPFVRPELRGRGTIGWHAVDPTTREEVLIKDSWRTSSRVPEWQYLQEVKAQDIPGVAEILAFQDDLEDTSQWRPPCFITDRKGHGDFHRRVKLRVVMKMYGPPIWSFRTRLDLIRAIRDAIIGHRKLFENNILHRDISVPNILLGTANPRPGYCGILIDLDMAIWIYREAKNISVDRRSIFHMYQSISVLRSADSAAPPPHDYLDDLEAFLWVLLHIMWFFQRPGVRVSVIPRFMQVWRWMDPLQVAENKSSFLLEPLPWEILPKFWGTACEVLAEEFHAVLQEVHRSRTSIRRARQGTAEEKRDKLDQLEGDVETPYTKVMAAFNKAILALKEAGLNSDELAPYPTNPAEFPLNRPADLDSSVPESLYTPSQQTPAPHVATAEVLERIQNFRIQSHGSVKRGSDDSDHTDALRMKRLREGHGSSSLADGPMDEVNETLA